MTNLKPLNDYILVKQSKEEAKSASWIITAPTSKEKPWKWEVIAIWEGKKNPEWKLIEIDNIKIGDIVYFTKYAPEEIEMSSCEQFKNVLFWYKFSKLW